MNSSIILCGASLAVAGLAGIGVADEAPTGAANTNEAVAGKARAKADDTTGSIAGKITWEGDRPEAKPALTIKEKETEGCKHGGSGVDDLDRSLLISDAGGVANVVLTIEADGFDLALPEAPIVIDQQGCRFKPHVIVVPVGATLQFDNSDDTNHNIHTFAKKNQAINKNVAGGSTMDQKLDKAEVIDVKCDVHTWMKGYIIVTDATHWGISGTDGSFEINGLPPGEYKLSWWHEELGKGKTEAVTVAAGEQATLEHSVSASKKKSGGRRRR